MKRIRRVPHTSVSDQPEVTSAVRTFDELRSSVAALPPPKAGLVRVYRGQEKDYPLLPSGRRRVIPRTDIWLHYLRRLVMVLEGSGVHDDIESELQIWIVWLHAIAQHYGAGSNFLDVTHDLGVATWFAFHRSKSTAVETLTDWSDPFAGGYVARTNWMSLTPHAGPAYLYAFDLKPWSGDGDPDPGELVDLAQAPTVFDSARIRVQSGCLVYLEEGQDLASHRVPGTPIIMEAGFETSPYAKRSVEDMFPPPASDPWYARLLSLPLLLAPDEEEHHPTFTQPLPVTLFVSSPKSTYVADIQSRLKTRQPAWSHAKMSSGQGQWWADIAPEQATVLVLEGPQMSAHPSVDDPDLNHEILMSDQESEADTFEIGMEGTVGRTTLNNVIIEFSPLEDLHRETPGEVVRSLWIVRGRNGELAVNFLTEGPEFEIAQTGPIVVRLGPQTRRLQCRAPFKKIWEDIRTLGGLSRPIVASLVLLRDLSPKLKTAAYPSAETSLSKKMDILLVVSGSAARLFRASGRSGRSWFVVRHPDETPYTTARANADTLTIQSRVKFGLIPAHIVTEQLDAFLNQALRLLESGLDQIQSGPAALHQWAQAHPEALEAPFRMHVKRLGMQAGHRNPKTASNAHLLAAFLHTLAGDPEEAIVSKLDGIGVMFRTAKKTEGCTDAHGLAMGIIEEALNLSFPHLVFRAAGLAAACGLRGFELAHDPAVARHCLRIGMAGLLKLERVTLPREKNASWRYILNELLATYGLVLRQSWLSESRTVYSEVRRIAALADRLIPLHFSFYDDKATAVLAQHLAELSERYGNSAIGAIRRALLSDLKSSSGSRSFSSQA